MNETFEKLKNDMPFLSSLKIEYLNDEYKISNYDLVNMYIIYNLLKNATSGNFVLVHPTGRNLLLKIIINAGLTLYELNLNQNNDSLLKKLNYGDLVKVDGVLGRFLGIEEKEILENKDIVCKIKFADKLDIFFQKKMWWKIKEYNGDANKLQKYNPRYNTYKSERFLAEIFGVNKENNFRNEKNKILIVDNKKNIVKDLKKLKLNSIKFTRIFPSGYYTNFNKFSRLPGDPYQKIPYINIVSSIYIASSIIRRNKNINTLIINGESQLSGYYNDLKRLKSSDFLQNIIILLDSLDINQYSDLKDLGFQSWIWTDSDIKNIYSDNNFRNKDEDSYHYNILKNLYFSNVGTINLHLSDKCIEKRNDILNLLNRIRSKAVESEKLNFFLKIAYAILLHLQTVVFPLEEIEKLRKKEEIIIGLNIDNMLKKAEDLIPAIIGNSLRENFKPILNDLINMLKEFKLFFETDNLKYNKLIQRISSLNNDKKLGILMRKSSYITIFRKLLEEKGLLNRNVFLITINDLKNKQLFDQIIVSGWTGYKNIEPLFYKGNSRIMTFLLYNYEKEKYYLPALNNIKKQVKKYRSPLMRIKIPYIPDELYNTKTRSIKGLSGNDNITDILNELSKTHYKIGFETNNDNISLKKIKSYLITFNNGEYSAYITPDFKARVLNRQGRKIIKKNGSGLNKGDELIFARNSKNDIFKELLKEIESNNKEIKNNIKMANLWHRALKRYQKDKCGISWLRSSLRKRGFDYSDATILNWLETEDIIGPGKYKVIDAIAEITDDKKLKNNIEDVKKAVRSLRSLHNKLGRHLARTIVRAVVSDAKKIESEFFLSKINISGNLDDYAEVVEVTSKSDNFIEVNTNKVNILIENY